MQNYHSPLHFIKSSIKTLTECLKTPAIAIVVVTLFLILAGCTKIVKEPVLVPTKVDIAIPNLKPKSKNTAENIRNILEYTNLLECDLLFATGKKNQCEHAETDSQKTDNKSIDNKQIKKGK